MSKEGIDRLELDAEHFKNYGLDSGALYNRIVKYLEELKERRSALERFEGEMKEFSGRYAHSLRADYGDDTKILPCRCCGELPENSYETTANTWTIRHFCMKKFEGNKHSTATNIMTLGATRKETAMAWNNLMRGGEPPKAEGLP